VIDAVEQRKAKTGDVDGAYLHVQMKDMVIMVIEARLTAIILQQFPHYKSYVGADGKLYVILLKALYGCKESARLFYDHLSRELVKIGFVKNAYDQCVFNKVINGLQCTVVTHVDDLKISSKSEEAIDDVISSLTSVYKKINVYDGDIIDYLGMDLDYTKDGEVKVSMRKAIESLLSEAQVQGGARTPATNSLFDIQAESPALTVPEAKQFHSHVASLLYLAKRTRPDILLAVSFLSTRVKSPTSEDKSKLDRVLRYLNVTGDLAMVIRGSGGLMINAFIDASFGVHGDGKGHTGSVVKIGDATVMTKSSKQKLVAKSSTESELIALSDMAGGVIWLRNFMMEQGYHSNVPACIHQDNQSTMALIENGRSTSQRTRHVSIRYFFVKDRVDSGELKVTYLPTREMLGDFFTKPLQGERFDMLRDVILGVTSFEAL
jgi:hypothetical protein